MRECDRNFNAFLSISQLISSACKNKSHLHDQPCPAQADLQLGCVHSGNHQGPITIGPVSHVPGERHRALNVFYHVCLVHMTKFCFVLSIRFPFHSKDGNSALIGASSSEGLAALLIQTTDHVEPNSDHPPI